MEPEIGAPKPGLHSLPAEMHVRVLVHLPSTRDFRRAGRVCRAWRADGSPVEQALRQRIEARDGAVPTALPGAGTMMQRMCWSELLRDARMASGVISLGGVASAAVDADGHLCVWGKLGTVVDHKHAWYRVQLDAGGIQSVRLMFLQREDEPVSKKQCHRA